MYTLWVELPVALVVVFMTAEGSPRGQWLPSRGQSWLKTEDVRKGDQLRLEDLGQKVKGSSPGAGNNAFSSRNLC